MGPIVIVISKVGHAPTRRRGAPLRLLTSDQGLPTANDRVAPTCAQRATRACALQCNDGSRTSRRASTGWGETARPQRPTRSRVGWMLVREDARAGAPRIQAQSCSGQLHVFERDGERRAMCLTDDAAHCWRVAPGQA
jgi:hypothetical protein